MIILNERDYAERVIVSCDLGKKPMAAIWRIAKYYFALGEGKSKVKKLCADLLTKYSLMNGVSAERYIELLDTTLDKAKKQPLIEIDFLPVTAAEIETIDKLRTMQLRKLAFTLLLLAKYHIRVNPNNGGWVADSDSELFQMANVTGAKDNRYLLLHELGNAGLIEFGEAITNSSRHVLFINENSPCVFRCEDMRNLGYQYMQYIGVGRYMPCDCCKQLVAIGSHKPLRVLCREHKDLPERNQVIECPDCHMLFVRRPGARTEYCPRCFERRQRAKRSVANRNYRLQKAKKD